MRGFCRFALLLLLALLLPVHAGAETYLRVVGESDSRADVKEKLRVRDAVLEACPKDPSLLPDALEKISEAANAITPCTVSLRSFSPIKNAPALPTLYIEVGQAKGRNWFGLLYEDSGLLFSDDKEGTFSFIWPFLSQLFHF